MLFDMCHCAGYNHQVMNGTPKTNLSDLYSDREHAVKVNAIENEPVSVRSFDLSPLIIGLLVVTMLIVGLCIVAYAGYKEGADQSRIVVGATITSEARLQDDPDNPGDLVYSTEIPLLESTKVMIAERDVLTSSERLSVIRMSYDNQEWQNVISNIDMLKASSLDYDRDLLDGILFVALRNQGMQLIEGGDLELGLADLEHAEQMTGLDEAANQRRRWAYLYLSASMFWDINWKIVVDNLYILHQIAPNFRDTNNKLWKARTYYGGALLEAEEYCLAEEQFAFALSMKKEASIADKLLESSDNCDKVDAVPDVME
jgi:hypothetical protein